MTLIILCYELELRYSYFKLRLHRLFFIILFWSSEYERSWGGILMWLEMINELLLLRRKTKYE